MERRILTKEILKVFNDYLLNDEKSKNTIDKYIRDSKKFMFFSEGQEIAKEIVISFKQQLIEENYSIRSINSILASINSLFAYLGWYNCKIKNMKLQREIYIILKKKS